MVVAVTIPQWPFCVFEVHLLLCAPLQCHISLLLTIFKILTSDTKVVDCNFICCHNYVYMYQQSVVSLSCTVVNAPQGDYCSRVLSLPNFSDLTLSGPRPFQINLLIK